MGVAIEDIDVTTGDTDQFNWGVGTFASRGATVAGNAIHAAALNVRKKIFENASEYFEVAEEDLVIEDGKVSVKGSPSKSITLGELALTANPLRGSVKPGPVHGL